MNLTSNQYITDKAKEVFDIEAKALSDLSNSIDEKFALAVEAVLASKGKLIVCGMGKSGLIGKKIAATLASTGTPSFFLHPGEAFHGDLGMVGKDDILMLLSYSGETDEVLKVIPFLKWNGNKIIAMSGNPNSTLAKNADFHLSVKVHKEACPLQLAPTSSTTATLAMGDALAVALMEVRNFQPEDFARFHPGGSLGRRLLTKVKDLMRTNLPFISPSANYKELILKMTEGRTGFVLVGTKENVLGIITDGDLRRALLKFDDLKLLTITEIMNKQPIMVEETMSASEAESLMKEKRINTLIIKSANNEVRGAYQIFD